jgi:hypothetical protein
MKKSFTANDEKRYFFKPRMPWAVRKLFLYTIPEFLVSIKGYFRRQEKPKRFPQDYTRQELISLLLEHHAARVVAQTKVSELSDKLKDVQIQLSSLKRKKPIT